MSPNSGPLAGGTALTITGANFPATVDSVQVGTALLASLVRASETQLTGTVPAGSAAGSVDVVVYTTSAGSGTCAACFTYVVFARYTVTFLGAGFDASQAADLNDSGSVVGQVLSAGAWRGRLWPNAGAATDLGAVLPVAVNNRGSIVGDLRADTGTTSALWENGAVLTLPSRATDINDQRQVAMGGGIWQNDSVTAFRINVDANMITASNAGRMNGRGEVAASCTIALGPVHQFACVLSTGRGPSSVGTGRAVALNDDDWVIGREYGREGRGWLSPCCYLPFIPAALNNSLQIVGEGSIWQDGATASLTALVLDSTWQVSSASAINERGQIAAYGVNSATGAAGAIRLDPVAPAPGSAAVRRR